MFLSCKCRGENIIDALYVLKSTHSCVNAMKKVRKYYTLSVVRKVLKLIF